MSRVPQGTGAHGPKTSQVSAEDTQLWLDASPHDMISVEIEVEKTLRDTPMMQAKRGLPSHVLVVESLVEKDLKFGNEIDGEEYMNRIRKLRGFLKRPGRGSEVGGDFVGLEVCPLAHVDQSGKAELQDQHFRHCAASSPSVGQSGYQLLGA